MVPTPAPSVVRPSQPGEAAYRVLLTALAARSGGGLGPTEGDLMGATLAPALSAAAGEVRAAAVAAARERLQRLQPTPQTGDAQDDEPPTEAPTSLAPLLWAPDQEVLHVDSRLDALAADDAALADVVLLRYFAGFDNAQAAALLGEAPSATAASWSAARHRLLPASDQSADALSRPAYRPYPLDPPGDVHDPVAGHRLGAYRLLRRVGQGGMGSVWLAERSDGRYDGHVAVKLLRAEYLLHAQGERFRMEGRILARLDHPHIARLLDAGVAEGGLPYWVLEWVDGLPLDRHADERQLDLRGRLELFADVLAAVAHAHGRLILHRDLKPSNIMVDRAGQVKLLDFGVAKLMEAAQNDGDEGLTRDLGPAFTPRYAAPEQLLQDELTTATDTYALGLLLFRLVTGEHAFGTETAVPLMQRLTRMQLGAPRASRRLAAHADAGMRNRARFVAGELDTLIDKALRYDAAERYRDAAEFAADLERLLRAEPIHARSSSTWHRSRLFVRRHRWALLGSSAAALALVATAAFAWHQAGVAQARRAQADELVGFMVGEMREHLAAAGRLDLLAATARQVLSHDDRDDLAQLPTAALLRRTEALGTLASVALAQADADLMVRAHLQAQAVARTLEARHASAPAALAAGAVEAQLATYRLELEKADPAVVIASAARAAERAEAAARGSADHAWLAGGRYNDWAVYLSDAGRIDDSARAVERALHWLVPLVDSPAARRDVFNSQSLLANARFRQGRWAECVEAARPLLPTAPDAASDVGLEEMRAGGLNRLVACQLALGNTPAALQASAALLRSTTLLAQAMPDNRALQHRLLAQGLQRVDLLTLAGERAEALALFETLSARALPQLETAQGQDEALANNWLRDWLLAATRLGQPWRRVQGPWTAFVAADGRIDGERPAWGRRGGALLAGTWLLDRSDLPPAERRTLEATLAFWAQTPPEATDFRGRLAAAAWAERQGDRAKADEMRAALRAAGWQHPDLTRAVAR